MRLARYKFYLLETLDLSASSDSTDDRDWGVSTGNSRSAGLTKNGDPNSGRADRGRLTEGFEALFWNENFS